MDSTAPDIEPGIKPVIQHKLGTLGDVLIDINISIKITAGLGKSYDVVDVIIKEV